MADLTVSSDIDTFMASANFAAARTNLGLELGSDIQAYDAQLQDIAGLATTDGGFIVGNGSAFVLESGATARTSLGVAIGSDVQAYDAQLADIAGLSTTDGGFIVGNGTNFVLESGATARTSLGLGSIAVLSAPSGTVVGTSDTQTLTNKTIDGDSNTISNLDIGNEVDWAAAADVADRSAAPASGDKLLLFEAGVGLRKIDWDDLPSGGGGGGGLNDLVDDTTPQLGGQLDVNGNAIGDGTLELLAFTETGSAVNHVNITNAATGNGPLISAVGDDTNIDLDLTGKGTGAVAIRNGTTAQTLNIYNTYTASDNFERLEIKWDTNTAVIGAAAGGAGGTTRLTHYTTENAATADSPQFKLSGFDTGICLRGNDDVFIVCNGIVNASFQNSGLTRLITWNGAGVVGFANGEASGTPDTSFVRTGAGLMGVRADSATAGAALNLLEQTAPSAPSANQVHIYAEDNGSGKTRLMALFPTGAAQQIAIEP